MCEHLRSGRPLSVVVLAFALVLSAPAFGARADATRDKQWHLGFLKADQLHALTRGDGVKVAVLDSGVYSAHPDLRDNVLPGVDLTTEKTDGRVDVFGHGTHMASLIASHGHGGARADGALGLAPAAKIVSFRVSVKTQFTIGALSESVRRAADLGAHIINISLGGGRDTGWADNVRYALHKDVVVVIAAGNSEDGPTVDSLAREPGLVVVSGVNQAGSFSSVSTSGEQVVLAAPAENLTSAGLQDRYSTASGTSGATALVSAAAALVRSRYPDLNAASVINRLIRTADDKGPPGRDPQYGFGVVNPLAALTADIPPVDRNPLLGPQASPTTSPTRRAESRGGSRTGLAVAIAVVTALAVLTVVVVAVLVIRARRRQVLRG